MQIILLEKVVNLGTLGDVVRVKDGYARNFLIPKGKARRATEATIKEFEARRADLEKIQADKLAQAQAVGAKLEGMSLPISQKAGVDIAAALNKHGFADVEKAMVRLPNGPLKIIGDHDVSVALHPDVVVAIKVAVSPEV
jgi:large subunit ribosomal protein L9